MHLNIKNDEAHRMAKELSRLTGENLTQAVTRAIEQRLERERSARRADRAGLALRLQALAAECAALPDGDPRPADEILYDEHGLPKDRPDRDQSDSGQSDS